MGSQPETATYDAGVYQLETVDPVQGGVGGKSNAPLLNLANRTAYLKQHLDNLESGATVPAGIAVLNSPTFTGDPKAPTPALGDNDTSIATTAFVQGTVGGRLVKSVAGGSNVTLSAVEAGNGILEFNGSLTANISVIVPTSPTRAWFVKNSTSGGFTLSVKTASGTGVVCSQGKVAIVFTDGTNVYDALTDFDSVALTGTPTAPTATTGTSTTQIATTAFVQAAVAALVASSPAALDTLKELADALGDDPNFATTMTNALAAKAPLASPALTGTPTAPTAATADNSTTLATTAFVKAQGYAPLASPALTGNPTAPTPTAGDNDTSIATTAFVQSAVNAVAPTGSIAHFPANAAIPGYVKANGALLSRTTYAALWAFAQASNNITASDAAWSAASTPGSFSPGDGSTTFRIPDLRGLFVRSLDDSAGIDSGRGMGSRQNDAFQGHHHAAGYNTAKAYTPGGTNSDYLGVAITNFTDSIGAPTADGTSGTPRTAAETRPVNAALLACIKY